MRKPLLFPYRTDGESEVTVRYSVVLKRIRVESQRTGSVIIISKPTCPIAARITSFLKRCGMIGLVVSSSRQEDGVATLPHKLIAIHPISSCP